jgi:hypothetical protein
MTKIYRETWANYPYQEGEHTEDIYAWEGPGSTKWVTDLQGEGS